VSQARSPFADDSAHAFDKRYNSLNLPGALYPPIVRDHFHAERLANL